MQTTYKDTQEAPVKWWAARDASMRNTVNKTNWGPSVQLKVEQIKMVLDYLYGGRIYEAYGKKQVSIKIDKPHVKDSAELARMEAYWGSEGITKTETAQGILYKIV